MWRRDWGRVKGYASRDWSRKRLCLTRLVVARDRKVPFSEVGMLPPLVASGDSDSGLVWVVTLGNANG